MPDDRDYYRERADAELQHAALAASTEAAKAHYELAGRYLDLVHGTQTEPQADAA